MLGLDRIERIFQFDAVSLTAAMTAAPKRRHHNEQCRAEKS